MWYVLNYIPASHHSSNSAEKVIERFNSRSETSLQIFAPKFVELVDRNGRKEPKEHSLTYHYTFVKGNENDIKALCAETNGFSLVINHGGEQRYLTVSQPVMDAFRRIAATYQNQLPCYNPADIPLEEGDEVEVVTGDYPGIRGVYLPKRGGRSGNIYISVAHNFATVVYDVKAEFVKIIRFARGSRRPYDQLDAIIPRLLQALVKTEQQKPLSKAEIAHLAIFCQRMAEVEIRNPKFFAKLLAVLAAANSILGKETESKNALLKLAKELPMVTNPQTLAEIELFMYGVDRDRQHLKKAESIILRISAKEKSKSLIQLENAILALSESQPTNE